MSNQTTTCRDNAVGNAATTVFPFTFLAYTAAEIAAYVNGVLQTLNTHYTVAFTTSPVVSGTPSAGSITFIAVPAGQASGIAPANNVNVQIVRVSPYTQAFQPTNTGALDAGGALQQSLDELSMQIQQVNELLNRTPSLSQASIISLGEGALPDPVAGQYLTWNGAGNGIANAAGPPAGGVTIPLSPASAILRVNAGGTAVEAALLPVLGTGGLVWFVGTTGGTSTAYTYTPAPFPVAYAQGMVGVLKMHASCGASPTLSLAGIGPKALMYYTQGGTATALVANDLLINENYLVAYDGTLDKFVVLGSLVQSSFASFFDTRRTALNLPASDLNMITGLILTAAAGTTTLTIGAGTAMDSTGAQFITIGAFTKLLDAAGTWTSGTGGKGNQAASAASASYHIFLIGKTTDLTAADIFFDSSVTAANLAASAAGAAGFNVFKRIGSLNSDGAKNWVVTRSYEIEGGGLRFELDVPVQNFSTANPGTSAVVWTTSAPTGVKFRILGMFQIIVAAVEAHYLLITSPDQTDTVPSATIYTFAMAGTNEAANTSHPISVSRMCSTTATLRYRFDAGATTNVTVKGVTNGWEDARRS